MDRPGSLRLGPGQLPTPLVFGVTQQRVKVDFFPFYGMTNKHVFMGIIRYGIKN